MEEALCKLEWEQLYCQTVWPASLDSKCAMVARAKKWVCLCSSSPQLLFYKPVARLWDEGAWDEVMGLHILRLKTFWGCLGRKKKVHTLAQSL